MLTLSELMTASMDETLRIARLASAEGEPYTEQLWLLCQHTGSEEIRQTAYAALCRQAGGRVEPL